MNMEELRSQARGIVNDPTLTFHQRRHYLAWLAENSLEYPELSTAAAESLWSRGDRMDSATIHCLRSWNTTGPLASSAR